MTRITLQNITKLTSAFFFIPLLSLAANCYSTATAYGQTEKPNANPKKPNILFILVDDLGKEWIQSYGGQNIKTPNIDRLAKGGMKFNNVWCMPQCTPTRVTLLTGQYPFRHGWTNHWDVPRWGSGAHFDPKKNPTYVNLLKKQGYTTCAAGKWQIDDFRVEPNAMKEAGFDQWCMWTGYETGNKKSGKRYWNPYIYKSGKPAQTFSNQFGPDIFCDYLIDFIQKNKDRPMFLYYPMTLTHGPIVNTPDTKDQNLRKNQKFAGMVRYTDKIVGKLVTAIEKAGIADNTIIVFTTDNGTGGGVKNSRNGKMVSGGKAKMKEQNGTAQPFVVYCPGKVPSGIITDELVDFTDIFPTFTELAGGSIPSTYKIDGKSIAPLLLGKTKKGKRSWILSMGGKPAAFRNGRVVPKDVYDDRVIRNQRYKLWINKQRQPTALYDLVNDPWETTNLIKSEQTDAIFAKKALLKIAQSFPAKDAAPKYSPNPPQKWDRKKFRR